MAQVGRIKATVGSVRVRTPDGQVRQLFVGDVIYEDEIIETAADSGVTIELNNGRTLNLAESSQVVIDETVVTTVDSQNEAVTEDLELQAALELDEEIPEEETAAGEEDEGYVSNLVYYAGNQFGSEVHSYLFGPGYGDEGQDHNPAYIFEQDFEPELKPEGDDYIKGSAGDDIIYGQDGNDIIYASYGNDLIYGGYGDDIIYGQDGDDTIDPGPGNNVVDGGSGFDTLVFGSKTEINFSNVRNIERIDLNDDGVDQTIELSLDQALDMTDEDNTLQITGEKGDSVKVTADAGVEWTYNGDAFCFSSPAGFQVNIAPVDVGVDVDVNGDLTIYRQDGDDVIYAGAGNDVVYADGGDDTIYGQEGDDTIDAGTGNDTIDAGSGDDAIDAGDGDDIIYAGSGNDVVYGGSGMDSIYGQEDNDTIYAGLGDDLIEGGDGNDTIYGQEGDDTIDAGTGNDTIDAGSGDDAIDAGSGNDIVDGGSGFDTLIVTSETELDFSYVSNIESIDLNEDGVDQTLTLSLDQILSMTDDDNTLQITGESGDSVTLTGVDGGEWTHDGNGLFTNVADSDIHVAIETMNDAVDIDVDVDNGDSFQI